MVLLQALARLVPEASEEVRANLASKFEAAADADMMKSGENPFEPASGPVDLDVTPLVKDACKDALRDESGIPDHADFSRREQRALRKAMAKRKAGPREDEATGSEDEDDMEPMAMKRPAAKAGRGRGRGAGRGRHGSSKAAAQAVPMDAANPDDDNSPVPEADAKPESEAILGTDPKAKAKKNPPQPKAKPASSDAKAKAQKDPLQPKTKAASSDSKAKAQKDLLQPKTKAASSDSKAKAQKDPLQPKTKAAAKQPKGKPASRVQKAEAKAKSRSVRTNAGRDELIQKQRAELRQLLSSVDLPAIKERTQDYVRDLPNFSEVTPAPIPKVARDPYKGLL